MQIQLEHVGKCDCIVLYIPLNLKLKFKKIVMIVKKNRN